jgi:uncharacterized protein YndB with AHSA1/START domain
MPATSTARIEKQIVIDSPRSRVWRAVSDVREFNKWFGAALTSPFAPGAVVSGKLTIPGYDHLTITVWVEKVQPETFFSFRWHPNAMDQSVDYSKEATTLVTFTLDEVTEGTRLTIVETGFDALPESRRIKAFTSNDGGWGSQIRKIGDYLEANR